jgi:hypothetical protein
LDFAQIAYNLDNHKSLNSIFFQPYCSIGSRDMALGMVNLLFFDYFFGLATLFMIQFFQTCTKLQRYLITVSVLELWPLENAKKYYF